LVPKSF